VVGVAVGGGIERECEEQFDSATKLQDSVAQGTTSEAMSPKQWTPSSLRSSARKISFSSPPWPAMAPRGVLARSQRPTA
jgi:hypothetical protein